VADVLGVPPLSVSCAAHQSYFSPFVLISITLQEASLVLSTLLLNCVEAQRTYLAVLTRFRSALKDVISREAELRLIIRDRDILIKRLAKLSSKRPSESSVESHQAKLEEAKNELAACQAMLKHDEWDLVGIKTTILKEAWVDRLRALGELARVYDTSSQAGLEALERVDGPQVDDPDGQNYLL
jgi:hypothetical protein